MANTDKFQPMLGGPSQMGATVAEVKQGPSPFAYINQGMAMANDVISYAAEDAAYELKNIKRANKEKRDSLKTQISNEYASELSSAREAYQQGSLTLDELDVTIRGISDKYYSQGLVSASTLNSIRDGVIGVDVGGKFLERDFVERNAKRQRTIDQRNTLIDNAKKKHASWSTWSDEQVMSAINRDTLMAKNIVNAQEVLGEMVQAGDEVNAKAARENVNKALIDQETFNVYTAIMDGIHLYGDQAVFTPQAMVQNRQILYKRLTDFGVEAGEANYIIDQIFDATGYSEAVKMIEDGVTTVTAWDEKSNKAMLAAFEKNIYLKMPSAALLKVIPPEVQAQFFADTGLLQSIQDGVKNIVYGLSVNNTGDVNATRAYGVLLNSMLNGNISNTPVRQITTLGQGAFNGTSLPTESIPEGQEKTVEENVESALNYVKDRRVQDMVKAGTPEDQAKYLQTFKQVVKGTSTTYKHSMQQGQWSGNLRFEEKTGRIVMVGDENGNGILKTLSSPYSATMVEKMNGLFDIIDGNSLLSQREKSAYKEALLKYWGITPMAEGESRTGLGGLTVKQVGNQVMDLVGKPAELITEAVLANKDPNYRGEIGQAYDTVKEYYNENKEEIKEKATDAIESVGDKAGQAVAEVVINLEDSSYRGEVEEAIDTVYEALPEAVKGSAEALGALVAEIENNITDPDTEGEIEQSAKFLYNKFIPAFIKESAESPAEAVAEIILTLKDPSHTGKYAEQLKVLKDAWNENAVGTWDKFKKKVIKAKIPAKARPEMKRQPSRAEQEYANETEQVAEKQGLAMSEVDLSESYNTHLSEADEKKYQQWVKKTGKENDVFDYDLRGAWKNGAKMGAKGHLPDKYKKPNHPTFSKESIYYKPGMKAGEWIVEDGKDVYIAPAGLSKKQMGYLIDYFAEHEIGNELRFEKGVPTTLKEQLKQVFKK